MADVAGGPRRPGERPGTQEKRHEGSEERERRAAAKKRDPGRDLGTESLRRGQRPARRGPSTTSRRSAKKHLQGLYHIEIIDLLKNPRLARGDQIVAVPTLVRKLPEPVRKIIGDLSDRERVLVGLDVRLRTASPSGTRRPK